MSSETTQPASTRTTAARCVWGLLAVVTALSLVTDLGRVLTGASGGDEDTLTRVVRFWSYFTILSNVLVCGVATSLARDPDRDGALWRVLRLDALLCITVTGLVYAVVLAPTLDPQGLGVLTNAGLHYVSPVLTLLAWLVFGPRPRIAGRTVVGGLVVPVAWVAYTLVHGAVSGWYPYPFLDVAAIGYAAALRNTAGVVVLSLAFVLLFAVVERRLPATDRAALTPAA